MVCGCICERQAPVCHFRVHGRDGAEFVADRMGLNHIIKEDKYKYIIEIQSIWFV